MSLTISNPLIHISQGAEWRTGNTRLSDGFAPGSSPFTSGANRCGALLSAWNGWTFSSFGMVSPTIGSWCNWSGNTAGLSLAAYNSGTDTFADAARMVDVLNAVAAAATAQGGNANFRYCPGIMLRSDWTATSPTDALQRRLVDYVATRIFDTWAANGGNADRIRFLFIPQRNVTGGTGETWRKFRVSNGILGLDGSSGVAAIDRVIGPYQFGVGEPDGVHNFESQNQRIGEACAHAISKAFGGKQYLGASGPPRFGRWWRTSSTTAVVPLLHGNGARAMIPSSPAPALRWGTSLSAGGSNTLTITDVNTSQAASGRTLLTVSSSVSIPDVAYLTNNEGTGGTFGEIMLDYTPSGTWTRADYNAFTDVYTAVSPSIVRPMIQQVPLLLSDPSEAWDGARDAHPSAPGGPPTVTLTEGLNLGNGSIRARFVASGGVTLVRATLRRVSDNTIVSTVLLPITTAAEHIFTGLTNGQQYRVEYAPRVSATGNITVS